MINLKDMKLSTKILFGSLVTIIPFVALLGYIYPDIKRMEYDGKRQKVVNLVESAMGVLEYYDSLVKSGQMKLPEAQKMAMQTVGTLRYDQKDYFWINDFNHVVLMHPFNKDIVGKDQSGNQDAKGTYMFREFVKVCKDKGGGFVEYYWTKPNQKKPSPKISYVKAFQPWGWIVGTGIYEDDVEKELNVNQWLYWMGVVAIAITIVSLFMALWNTRSIAKPINRVVEGLMEGANQVSAASSKVSSASQFLAEGSSEQAAGLEETSSSMEEMASMTKQNADNAQQAKTMMAEALQVVSEVNKDMQSMGKAIGEITKSSEETSQIIKTIEEIAFQTNLLALNAAVEAARAGEAGAGFAVVADEVRNLAIRAAEAAKNTSHLIEDIIKSVKSGHELTRVTQEAFKKNVEISGKIGKLIEEISAASQEQAQGVEQVNKAVAEMDKVTQQNAANAEESASAAKEMNAQAEQMKIFVGELGALIKGIRHGAVAVAIEDSLPHRGDRSSIVAGHRPGHGGGNRGRKTVAAVGKKERKMEVAGHMAKGVRPDQVIPLEDGDFQEF